MTRSAIVGSGDVDSKHRKSTDRTIWTLQIVTWTFPFKECSPFLCKLFSLPQVRYLLIKTFNLFRHLGSFFFKIHIFIFDFIQLLPNHHEPFSED